MVKAVENNILYGQNDVIGGDFDKEAREKKEKAKELSEELRRFYDETFLKFLNCYYEDGIYNETIKKIDFDNFINKVNEIMLFLEDKDVVHTAHDVSSTIKKSLGMNSSFISYELEDREEVKMSEIDKEIMSYFIKSFGRWYVSAQDLLTRIAGKENKGEEEFDVRLLAAVINFFNESEVKNLPEGDIGKKDQDKQYTGVKKGKTKFIIETDFQKLFEQLKGKKVVGDMEKIDNLWLNISRNGLKDRVRVRDTNSGVLLDGNVYSDIFIDGDELVIRVMNDGKGIAPKHVELGGPDCIFNYGMSGTGSTGFGLANAHLRVLEAGGQLRLTSNRKDGEGIVTKFGAVPDDYLKNIKEERMASGRGDINTIWEIRLKLKDK